MEVDYKDSPKSKQSEGTHEGRNLITRQGLSQVADAPLCLK